MLRRNPRPDEDAGTFPPRTRWPVAWKTGTSWGFRDAWTAGVVGPYVLVVWIGNFDGQGNPAFVGVDAAAPLFFRIVDALNLARPDEAAAAVGAAAGRQQGRRVRRAAAICRMPQCPHTVDTWYIPGKSPIRVSQLHRTVAIDAATGASACPPYPAGTRFEVFEFWSSDMLKLFRAGRHAAPHAAAAADLRDGRCRGGAAHRVAAAQRDATRCADRRRRKRSRSTRAPPPTFARVFWFDGSALIGAQPVADGALAWRPTTAGVHLIRVVDDHGRSAERDVEVQLSQ